MGISWLILCIYSWYPIFIKFINTGCTFTWNHTNCTKTFSKFWINSVMIMKKNIISSSRLELFCSNWVHRKLPIIPSHVYVFLLQIFYVLDVIITVGNLVFSCRLLFVLSLLRSNDDTCLPSLSKLTA